MNIFQEFIILCCKLCTRQNTCTENNSACMVYSRKYGYIISHQCYNIAASVIRTGMT